MVNKQKKAGARGFFNLIGGKFSNFRLGMKAERHLYGLITLFT